jgi:hypothetical protein
MADKTLVEIYVAMNESGEYAIDTDEEGASTRLMENSGGFRCRIIKINAKIAPPTLIEADLDVPDEAGKTEDIEVMTEAA